MDFFSSNKLLVPVRKTEGYKKVLLILAIVAYKWKRELVLLSVLPQKDQGKKYQEAEIDKAKQDVIDFAKDALGDWYDGLKTSVVIKQGQFKTQLLSSIGELKPALVGLSYKPISSGLFNQVSDNSIRGIINNSTRAIWLVPEDFDFPFKSRKEIENLGALDKYGIPRRILVPIDFSVESAQSLDRAIDIAGLFKATIYVIHVIDPGIRLPFMSSGNTEKIYNKHQKKINTFLKDIMAMERGVPIRTSIVFGSPGQRIIKIARKEGIHLIFLGVKQKNLWEKYVEGTTLAPIMEKPPCSIITNRASSLIELDKRFNELFTHLSMMDLQTAQHETSFTPDDLFSTDSRNSNLLLGFYTQEGIIKSLEHYGILKILRKKGFDNFVVDLNTSNPFRQEIKLYHDSKKDPDHLLTENYVHEGITIIKHGLKVIPDNSHFYMLYVDWVSLQNPEAKFSPDKPKLPGQEYPGLGIGYMSFKYISLIAKRLNKDGISNFPQHYYNAHLYHEQCRYKEPYDEAVYLALKRDTIGHSLSEISWAIEKGFVINKNTGKPYEWEGKEMIYPINEKFDTYFDSEGYHKQVAENLEKIAFEVNWNEFSPVYEKIMSND